MITANQAEAYIQQGVEIPYEQSTSSGATAVESTNRLLTTIAYRIGEAWYRFGRFDSRCLPGRDANGAGQHEGDRRE